MTDDEVKALLDGIAHGDDTLQASMLTARGINAIEAAAPVLARAYLARGEELARLRAERDAWRKGSEAQATEVEALRKERDDALDAARQQDALRGATLATTRSVSADLAAAQAQIEALKAILHDAGALRDAADRVSEWFCTEARHLEGPRIQALRMAMVAYDRHMQPTALPVPNFSAGWPLEEGDGSIIVGAALTAKEGE